MNTVSQLFISLLVSKIPEAYLSLLILPNKEKLNKLKLKIGVMFNICSDLGFYTYIS